MHYCEFIRYNNDHWTQGTFCYVAYKSIFCDKCILISNFPNFQKWAWQLTKMFVQKDQWKCALGVGLDILHTYDLLESYRKWKRRCQTTNDHIFLLDVALTRVAKSKDYFSIKLESVFSEGFFREITELFRRVFNLGVFENCLVLLKLLTNIGSNFLPLNKTRGKGNKKHYHPSTIKLFVVVPRVLQNFRGSVAYNFLNKNWMVPCLNTSRKVFCKEGLIYSYISMSMYSCI